MAYTTIDDPSAHRQTLLYTGNGSARSLTNTGNSDLQPDWVWIKERDNAVSHRVFDSTRGAGKRIFPNNTDAESTHTPAVTSFNSDGFSVGDGTSVNENGDLYVAFQWKAGGGSRTTFTESGDNPGGGYQANTTAGFSIVDFVGTGANGTVQHGLGVAPRWYIVKNRDRSTNWQVYHEDNGNTHYIKLNTTGAKLDNHEIFNDTSPTSSVFSVGIDQSVNFNGENHIAYVFTPIQGFSKFGSYTGGGEVAGNNDASGPFIYTGFKPAWVMLRNTKDGEGWFIHDSKIDDNGTNDSGGSAGTPGNPREQRYQVNENQAEVRTVNAVDFLSNGFKLRTDTGSHNGADDSFIYMAFAEHPFVSSKGVPVTAG